MSDAGTLGTTAPGVEAAGTDAELVLEGRGLEKRFPVARNLIGRVTQRLVAVDGVDIELRAGETLGVVGESGSGKTTLGRMLAHLIRPDAGTVSVLGRQLGTGREDLRWLRRNVQMIFQDPFSSLDPTKTIRYTVREPLVVQGIGDPSERDLRVDDLLEQVGLPRAFADRYPDELSGGQRQRVSIARALAPSPPILIADEPTSALDLSTRSEIINLMLRLQEERSLAMIVISHDFATIRHVSHRVAVMYMGRVVEQGEAQQIADTPDHPYTRALMSAVPGVDPDERRLETRVVLSGAHPNPADLPPGCRFQARCPEVMDRCRSEAPIQFEPNPGQLVECHLYGPSTQ
jgi:oligopeptide/dipeptide ABC transporter ATP-binding protein